MAIGRFVGMGLPAPLVTVTPLTGGFASDFRQEQFFVEADTGMKLLVVAKIPGSDRVGRAVLLVHGSGVGWEYWDIPIRTYSIMNYLAARGIDVYAVQSRGYAGSTRPNGMEVNAESMAKDMKSVVAAIAKRSQVAKVSLAGHSSGGVVVLAAAGMYPQALDRLVLVGTPYKKVHPQFVGYANTMIEAAKQPGKDYVPNQHHLAVETRLDAHDEDVIAWYKELVGRSYGAIPGGVFPDVILNPAISIVPKLRIPTLVLNGSNEYVVDPDDARDMFRDLGAPDKALIVQPGGYHLMFLEKRGHVGMQESLFFWITKK